MMSVKVKVLFVFLFSMLSGCLAAQPLARWEKMSPWLRLKAREQLCPAALSRGELASQGEGCVCAFLRLNSQQPLSVLTPYHVEVLASAGNVHVVSIPWSQLARLSFNPHVERIEARALGQTLLDSLSLHINAVPAYQGQSLPQAFTGKDVVVGVMDIGFDLTHPTFYHRNQADHSSASPDTAYYRIRRLWDMLSPDTVGSQLYVGRDYTTAASLLELGHSHDGFDMTHGTHTSGIAAGSGYNSVFRGIAPESDLCLVANAVTDNAVLIDSALLDRFTFATDALGFKYIFDYAKSVNKPCVISFSEGSGQDFYGYDQLYYQMLDSLVGPGRILVAAAGNQGHVKSWFCKPPQVPQMGTFLSAVGSLLMCTLKSTGPFQIRVVSYGAMPDTLYIPTQAVVEQPDSVLKLSLGAIDSLIIQAYPSCYQPHETCYDLSFYGKNPGSDVHLSVELLGGDADVEFWRVNGNLSSNSRNPELCAGETTHNVHSPSSAPRVISVGATTYRDGLFNYKGNWKYYWTGEKGSRVPFSSVGPTMDGRVKPDVMAPGNNVVSAYSSYYLEHHPEANDIDWDVAHFDFAGRTYVWNSNSGTSMSCPAVAGAIALWLQAKPDLTPEEALQVIAHTSRRLSSVADTTKTNEYGYGEIDAYRGLLYLLGIDHVKEVSQQHTPAHISLRDDQLTITFSQPLASAVRMRLYTTNGRLVQTVIIPAQQSSYSISLHHLPAGIYALQLNGHPAVQGSTLIRTKGGL